MAAEVYRYINDGQIDNDVLVTIIPDGDKTTIEGTRIIVTTNKHFTTVVGKIEKGFEMRALKECTTVACIKDVEKIYIPLLRVLLPSKPDSYVNFIEHNGDVVGIKHIVETVQNTETIKGKIVENQD